MTALEISTDDVRVKGLETAGDAKISGELTVGETAIFQGKVAVPEGKPLYFDGGDDTYIYEHSADSVRYVFGGDMIMAMTEAGGSGNTVDFGTSGAGFTQATITFGATDTYCYFNRTGNKAHLTMTADIVDVHMYFPNVSCNCQLIVLQDGTGGWDVDYWRTYDQGAGNGSTVIWSGGSAPGLTETADKLDILSFYWDNDNHKAYGVASTNF